MILFIIKIICLFIAVFFTVANTYKAMLKDPAGIHILDFLTQAISITTFITLQWLI